MSLERADLDEALATGRDLGRLVKAQYDGFVEAGFSDSQAMYLAGEWMTTILRNGEGTP